MKAFLVKLHWLLSAQFGIDLLKLGGALAALPSYLHDLINFKRAFHGQVSIRPALHDLRDQAGALSEYYWQDMTVARMVVDSMPARHVDVGSLLTGFVSYVSMVLPVEVFDIRPLDLQMPNVRFLQADLMADVPPVERYCSSLSCLHTLEHFGLGRYGDPVTPNGRELGMRNLAAMLQPNGTLYLSTPVGRERVEFNANWISNPQSILDIAATNGLRLRQLWTAHSNRAEQRTLSDVVQLAMGDYTLAIFVFEKLQA